MGSIPVSFCPVAPAKIAEEMAKLFKGLESANERYSRSANRNVILFATSAASFTSAMEIVEVLSLVHPSRFFIVQIDEALQKVKTELAAYCHGVSKKEHSCSEVVKLSLPSSLLAAFPAIIRANLLIGMQTELFLLDPKVTEELLELSASLTDIIVIDAELYANRPALLERIARKAGGVIDLQWLALGCWREEIKMLFARPVLGAALPTISSITIASEAPSASAVPFCARLLSGWIADRLGLTPDRRGTNSAQRAATTGNRTDYYIGRNGGAVSLQLEVSKGTTGTRLSRVEMALRAGGSIVIERQGGELSATVTGIANFSSHRNIDADSVSDLLRRFFSVGESTANYPGAFRAALRS